MSAITLNIENKIRLDPTLVANITDFNYSEGEPIAAETVLKNPNLSLYCLDHGNRQAIFVETPDDVDLSQSPFYYQAQYEAAQRLVAVPYDMLHQLANDICVDDEQLIFIYSVGRCGSTLVSKAFNLADNVVSLAEPDFYTQLVGLSEGDEGNRQEISQLLQTCTRLVCKPTEQVKNPSAWALKFRPFGIENGRLLYQLFPDAKVVFLYRNGNAWLNSAARAFQIVAPQMAASLPFIVEWLLALMPLANQYRAKKNKRWSPIEVIGLIWLSVMQRYLELNSQGVPMLAVRYRELTTHPRRAMKTLFDHCGVSSNNMNQIYSLFEEDSQAGSILSQENVRQTAFELTQEHLAEFQQLLRDHQIIQTPDYVVPNTLLLDT